MIGLRLAFGPTSSTTPAARRHARCNMQGAQSRWGGRGAYNVPPLSGPTRAPHKHMQRGARRTPRTPAPPLGHAKTARRSFISHRIDHRTLHKSSCAATVAAPRLVSCHPRGTRRHAACGGNTVATVHSDLHAVGQLAVTPPPPPPRRIPPPPHTPPPPPPPPPLLPLRTFSRQTRGLPERKTRCHPPSPQR